MNPDTVQRLTIIQDILKISLDSIAKTATIPEFIKTLTTVMNIGEIFENSNTKTATTPNSEGISEILLNTFLVYRL